MAALNGWSASNRTACQCSPHRGVSAAVFPLDEDGCYLAALRCAADVRNDDGALRRFGSGVHDGSLSNGCRSTSAETGPSSESPWVDGRVRNDAQTALHLISSVEAVRQMHSRRYDARSGVRGG